MSDSGGTPTFTIQQIELIRRLRNSGLTKEQLVQAFDSFERIDAELGNVYNVPVSLAGLNQNKPLVSLLGKHVPIGLRLGNGVGFGQQSLATGQRLIVTQTPQADSLAALNGPTQTASSLLTAAAEAQAQVARAVKRSHSGEAASVTITPRPQTSIVVNSGLPVQQPSSTTAWSKQCKVQTSKILQDIIQERLTSAASSPTGSSGHSLPGQPGLDSNGWEADTDQDVKPDIKPFDNQEGEGQAIGFTPRRERFTFRRKHLEILELCFKVNQYPTYEERLAIGGRCNAAMVNASGRGLLEKEKMTPQNVAYWFSNRRKDIKRMAKEEGIETTKVILPSKVKRSPSPLSVLDGQASADFWGSQGGADWAGRAGQQSTGPVAFPTMVQRLTSDGLVEGVGSMDSVSSSPDHQSTSDTLTIKLEPRDPEEEGTGSQGQDGGNRVGDNESQGGSRGQGLEPEGVRGPGGGKGVGMGKTSGPGSTVDRIASLISSQLAAKVLSSTPPPPTVSQTEGSVPLPASDNPT